MIRHLPPYAFLGRPEPQGSKMVETASDHRFDYHHIVLQPPFQGSVPPSEDREKEGWNQSSYRNPCQRRGTIGYKFTSTATNDSFMLKPTTLSKGDIMAMDRAYIDYEKFQQLTERGLIYVTRMKKNLKYRILSDTMYQTSEGLMEVRVQYV